MHNTCSISPDTCRMHTGCKRNRRAAMVHLMIWKVKVCNYGIDQRISAASERIHAKELWSEAAAQRAASELTAASSARR